MPCIRWRGTFIKEKNTHTHIVPPDILFMWMETTQLLVDGAVRQRKKCKLAMFVWCNIYGALSELSCALSLLLWGPAASVDTGSAEEEGKDKRNRKTQNKTSYRMKVCQHVTRVYLPSYPILCACQWTCWCFFTLRSTCHSSHVITLYLQTWWIAAFVMLKVKVIWACRPKRLNLKAAYLQSVFTFVVRWWPVATLVVITVAKGEVRRSCLESEISV